MEEKKDEKNAASNNAQDFSMAWIKSAMDMFQGMQKLWIDPMMKGYSTAENKRSYSETSLNAAMKKWQAFYKAASAPESMNALLKGTGTLPGILAQLAQSSFSGFFNIQQKWLERAGKLGEHTEAYKFDNIDENMFRAWTETYEREFQQFFRIPQLGLSRSYQENFQQAMDKSVLYNSTMAEYIRMLTLPISRSMTVMDEQLAKMAENGELPSDPQEYYRLWVKILEGHYMTMYQSPEYLETLSKTLDTLTAYSKARSDVCEDMLSTIPIPSREEIDDLEREVFELKKRIIELEKKQNNSSGKKKHK